MLAYSSEIYEIDTQDIAKLPDGQCNIELPDDEIIIKLGDNKDYFKPATSPDCLIKGRKAVDKAIKNQQATIKVRVAFVPKNKWYDFISPLIRVFRYRLRMYGSNIYHISPQEIREMGLERNIRTKENAYVFSNNKYKIPEEDRQQRYQKLYESLKDNGFNDKYPLDIMICRNMGVKDTLNQGHHRMTIALDLKIDKVSVIFSSAGSAPLFLHKLLMLIAKINMFFKK